MTGVDLARWRARASRGLVVPSVLVLLIAACGSSGSSKPTSPHPSSRAVTHAPSRLLGTYTTTLKRSDLPTKAPRELTDWSRTWKLTIANSGGVSGGDALTIANVPRAGWQLTHRTVVVGSRPHGPPVRQHVLLQLSRKHRP